MKVLRNKSGHRRGDADRYSLVFFVLGALVASAAVFLIGFHVGRVVEKKAEKELSATKARDAGQDRKEDIRKEMSSYSEEAVRIPVVTPPPPPDAGEDLRKTEASATFPESLTRKDPSPPPLVKPKPPSEPSGERRFTLQAGALKSREAAASLKGMLEKKGFRAKVVHDHPKGKTGGLYKVRVGPYASREEAAKAMKEIRSTLKIETILLKD